MNLQNSKQFLINTLTSEGFKIVRITENENQNLYSWWVSNSFSPSQKGEEMVTHHVIEGYEITDLMNQTWNSEAALLNRFKNFLSTEPVLTMKFSETFKWKLYINRSVKQISNLFDKF